METQLPNQGPVLPLKVGPTQRYLVDQNDRPFLIHGDTAWSMMVSATKDDIAQYMENRRQKGFNSTIINLIEHKWEGPVNQYGEGPFTRPGDFSTPNEKYFQHADYAIAKAAENGIQVWLAPLYLGYIGTDAGWIVETLDNGVDKCREWGRFIGQRYKDYANIVWIMGADRNPNEVINHVNAMAEGIKENRANNLFTAHVHPECCAMEQYALGGWLDINCTYSYEIVHRRLKEDYARHPIKPYVLIESIYEGEYNASPVQIRRQAYWTILCGACGGFFGNKPLWGFYPGWEQAMESTGSQDMARLRRLFLSRPWHNLVPEAEFSNSTKPELIVSGYGEIRGLDFATAARTSDGKTIIAYLPSRRTVTMNMAKIDGDTVQAWWFDPRSGDAQDAGQWPASGLREFTPPAEGDWVITLDDASLGLPAPGTSV